MALLHAKKNFVFFLLFIFHPYFSRKLLQRVLAQQTNLFHNLEQFSISIFSYNKRASYHLDKDIKVEDKAKKGELYNWQRDDVTRKCRFKRNHCVVIHVNNRIPFLRVFYYTTRLHLDFCTRNMVMQA